MARSSKDNVPRPELYNMAALSVQIGTPLFIATGEMCVRRKPCRFLRVPAGSVDQSTWDNNVSLLFTSRITYKLCQRSIYNAAISAFLGNVVPSLTNQ